MRVGLLIYGSLETVSGGYLYDRKLVEYLECQGDQVEVVSLPWRSYALHLTDNLQPALWRHLRDLPVDVLIQDELNHPSLAWLNARLRGRVSYPIVSLVHHLRSSEQRPNWQNRLYRWVERQYLREVDGFVFNSETTRQAVESLAGAARPCVVAYPAGDRFQPEISHEEILRRARQPGPLRLVFLGNLIERKGLHTLLDALERLAGVDVWLDVIGGSNAEPAYAQALRQRASSDELDGKVRFWGLLDDAEVAERLRAAHVLVAPSSYEGFGIVYLEGMSFGLPAIGTTAGAAGEIITPGQDGFLVPPGDATALAECLRRLAEDRKLLEGLSLRARQRFLAHPTWEESMRRVRGFLEEVTSPPPLS